MRTPLPDDIPLLCRGAEIDRILAELQGTVPVAFVVAGAAGVGKTRLVGEAARRAAELGFATARAVASPSGASIPFGPFAGFLPDSGHSAGDLLGLLMQARDAIADRAGPGGRLLLTVDDVQHLDDGSVALVHQLIQTRTCSALLCVRTPGPTPDLVTSLWKDALAERIDLQPWDQAQTGEVLAGVLAGQISRTSARQIWEVSRGNALYVRELVISALDSGALAQEGGIWSLRRPLAAPGPLVELVASRLAGLAPEARAAIDVLAVGEPVGLSVLDKITDPGGLEEAEARGFVSVHQDGWRTEARLAHPLYGEAVRQVLPLSRRRRIAASLALAIEATGARRRDDLLRLGRWQLDAGEHGDPVLLTRAAKRAQEMFDMDLSAKLARAALDSGGGAEAGLMLGTAMFRAGHHAEAEAVLARATELCVTDDDLARIANARAYNLQLYADSDTAIRVLDEALAVITDDLPRLRLLGRLATNRLFAGDPVGAVSAAVPVLSNDDDRTSCQGSYSTSIALAFLGRGDEAVSVAYAALPRHRRAVGSTQLPEVQLIGAVFGHAASGRFAQAETDSVIGQDACLAAGDKEGHTTFLFMSGWVLIERGYLARAAAMFMDGASVNREINDPPGLRWCLAGIAMAEAMSGHADRATAAAAEFSELAVGPMTLYETSLIERSKAWVSACVGELSRAREVLKVAAGRAAASKLRIAEASLLHDLARLGDPKPAAPRLAELAELTEGDWVPALARHAAALVSGDAAELEESGRAFDALGASLIAAEAYTVAAAAYRSAGLARPASAAARRAAELTAACGDVTTPALAGGHGAEQLTRREHEIAGLAAAGVPSREIAERLFLSIRTVDNHLQNVYAKLGITSRDELARVLR
ncbi:MAG TPA: LuxR C-terminal-related transcriptional regulator [Streptosporangiaceae bacterium]|nr:LuxR C-terminal-related transcriptional regulator [Streptosporangiaceae bacterium]